ncbi:MAG: glycosyltransferase [Planctomycetota bacterium]|nr:glycosyltransferase [Planctomycetota bacterium]
MSTKPQFCSVVAPFRNGERWLTGYVSECLAVLALHYRDYELILIDDGSTDATASTLQPLLDENPRLRLIRLTRAYGRDIALAAGLDSAIGELVVLTSPEFDPPEKLPALAEAARCHGLATGVASVRPGESWVRRGARRLFQGLGQRYFAMGLPADATRLQAMTRQVAGAAIRARGNLPIFPVLPSVGGVTGTTLNYQPVARRGAHWQRSWAEPVDRALALLVLNSHSPLRLAGWLGLAGAGLNLLVMVYVMVVNLVKNDVAPGWTTLSTQMSVMFFLVFLVQAVLGEYVGRTLELSRDRNVYQILEERNGGSLHLTQNRNVLEKSA